MSENTEIVAAPVHFTVNGMGGERPAHNGLDGGDECNCMAIRGALSKCGLKARVHCVPFGRYRDLTPSAKHAYAERHGGQPSYAFDGVLGEGRSYVVVPLDFKGGAPEAKALSAWYIQQGVIDPADPDKATKRGRKSTGEETEGSESAEKAAAWQKHYKRVGDALDTLGIECERYRECAAFPQNEKAAGDITALVGMLSEQLPIAKELLKKLDGVELSWAPPRIDPAPGCVARLLPGEAAAFREEQDGMIDDAELDLLCTEACWVLKKVMPDGRRVIAEANVGLDTVRRALTIGDFLIVRAPEAPKA
jgi:hypothetical protein